MKYITKANRLYDRLHITVNLHVLVFLLMFLFFFFFFFNSTIIALEQPMQAMKPRAELNIHKDLFDKRKGTGLLTLHHLDNKKNGIIFNQNSINFEKKFNSSLKIITLNLGMGVKNLTSDDLLIVSEYVFYDYEMPKGHRRISVGAEVKSSVGEITANYYHPLSQKIYIANDIISERARKGWDIEMGIFFPYTSLIKLFAKKYYWRKDYTNSSDTSVNGHQFSVQLNSKRYFQIEIGTRKDNFKKGTYFINLIISPYFSTISYKGNYFNKYAFELVGLSGSLLEKIRRDNSFIIARKNNSV